MEKFSDRNARYAAEERRQIEMCHKLRIALEEAESQLVETSRGRNQNRNSGAMHNLKQRDLSPPRSGSPTLDKVNRHDLKTYTSKPNPNPNANPNPNPQP